MRPRAKAVAVSVIILSAVQMGAAAHFAVDVDVEHPRVNPVEQESAIFNISIANNGDESGVFEVNYIVSNPGWYFLPQYRVTIDSGETRSVPLFATPNREAISGNKGVLIRVSSSGEVVEKRAFFTVRQDSDILITRLETNRVSYRPQETVNVTMRVRNVRDRLLSQNAYRAVFQLDDRRETVPLPAMDPAGSETVSAGFRIGQFESGVKTLEARIETIEGVPQATRTAKLEIEQVRNVVVSRSTRFLFAASARSVTAKNLGNVPASDMSLTADVPSYLTWFVSFSEDPVKTTQQAGTTTYTWDIGDLSPGDTRTVTYRVNYWVPAVIILILLVAALVAVWEHRRPHIVKRVYRKDGTHAVHLRVENRSGRVLDDVVVKDAVPGIASLIEKFDASPPERIRQGEEDTEMEWRLGRMEPGEERILTYTISPQVQVEGSVTLPPAHLQYHRGEREKQRHSHQVQADFT